MNCAHTHGLVLSFSRPQMGMPRSQSGWQELAGAWYTQTSYELCLLGLLPLLCTNQAASGWESGRGEVPAEATVLSTFFLCVVF